METEPARMDAVPAMAPPVIRTLPPPERRAMVVVTAGGPAALVPMPPEAPVPVMACGMAAVPVSLLGPVRTLYK